MPNHSEKIEAYILDQLNKNERKAFEAEMQQNTELQNKVNEQRQVLQMINALRDQERAEQISHVIADQRDVILLKDRIGVSWKMISAIAAVIGLLVIAYFGFLRETSSSSDRLFSDYYVTYSISAGNRGEGELDELKNAIRLFKQNSFEAAQSQFETIYEKTNNTKWLLVEGICLMEIGQYKDAVKKMEGIVAKSQDLYHEQALWYSALCRLKLEEIANCKKLLQQLIAIPESYKLSEAKSLIKDLEQ